VEKNNSWYKIKTVSKVQLIKIKENSIDEFITEHYWGYASTISVVKLPNEYEVTHPKWLKYEVTDFEIEVDFAKVYGSEFQFLNKINAHSVILFLM